MNLYLCNNFFPKDDDDYDDDDDDDDDDDVNNKNLRSNRKILTRVRIDPITVLARVQHANP
jgi:hypothetical protein